MPIYIVNRTNNVIDAILIHCSWLNKYTFIMFSVAWKLFAMETLGLYNFCLSRLEMWETMQGGALSRTHTCARTHAHTHTLTAWRSGLYTVLNKTMTNLSSVCVLVLYSNKSTEEAQGGLEKKARYSPILFTSYCLWVVSNGSGSNFSFYIPYHKP